MVVVVAVVLVFLEDDLSVKMGTHIGFSHPHFLMVLWNCISQCFVINSFA